MKSLVLLTSALAAILDPEGYFSQQIQAENIRSTLRYYTSKAHPAGTDNDYEQAVWTRDQFRSFGLKAELKEYFPLLNYPVKRSLRLNEPFQFEAKLLEDIVDEDETSKDQNAVPTFLAYSANGSIKNASIVYGNYCRPKDLKRLSQSGIPLKGTIILCRYGLMFRGLKVKAAALYGAAGVLIYSDPKDDGYVLGPVYPKGPWRPKSAVQRGSIQDGVIYAGDPLTPFIAATKDAPRINMTDANIPKIPALPISYEDASRLLLALVGHGQHVDFFGDDWPGGLNVAYWTGPAGKLDMEVQLDYQVKPIWNVISVIEGRREPDRCVVLGNHRDAWVYGAVDPNSGSSVLVETARIFGMMLAEGWRPDRTIVLASWDGEEYGLLGSTEWVEDHVHELNKTAIAYINTDTGASGPNFGASASPSLATLIRDVSRTVVDPRSGKSLYDVWMKHDMDEDLEGEPYPRVGALGFGSDYVAFLQHVGIASMDLSFSGPYGVYHSNYDSFHWMEKFGDPKFEYHALLTQMLGKILIRLTTESVLPFDFHEYYVALTKYTRDLEEHFKEHYVFLKLDSLYAAVEAFRQASPKMQAFTIQNDNLGVTLLNDQLAYAERFFLDMNGIKGRPWYRHVIYAPGEWTGYQPQLFPGVYEAVDRIESNEKIMEAVQQVIDRIYNVAKFWSSKQNWNSTV
jgi:N-acetylated-alpha-linked acidic dipeptidase